MGLLGVLASLDLLLLPVAHVSHDLQIPLQSVYLVGMRLPLLPTLFYLSVLPSALLFQQVQSALQSAIHILLLLCLRLLCQEVIYMFGPHDGQFILHAGQFYLDVLYGCL